MSELMIHYLEDGRDGLDKLDVLLEHLENEKSNGGDTRCLCHACLHFWALHHLRALMERNE